MAGIFKKATTPFHVPTLAEADPDGYGALVAKRADLNAKLAAARQGRKDAERDLADDTTREVRPGVAELLGDGVGAKVLKRQRVAEAKRHESDVAEALVVLEQRIRDAKSLAVRHALAIVRPEFDRRMQSLCEALKVAGAAHAEFDALCNEMEHEDISIGHLGPRPTFLGSPVDGRIYQFIKEAGHV